MLETIIGSILISGILIIWIYCFKNTLKVYRLLPKVYKYFGITMFLIAMILMFFSEKTLNNLWVAVMTFSLIVVALSKLNNEKKEYHTYRRKAFFNVIINILPILLIIGVINISYYKVDDHLDDVTLLTHQTILVLTIFYLIEYHRQRRINKF